MSPPYATSTTFAHSFNHMVGLLSLGSARSTLSLRSECWNQPQCRARASCRPVRLTIIFSPFSKQGSYIRCVWRSPGLSGLTAFREMPTMRRTFPGITEVARPCENRVLYLHATFGRELRTKNQQDALSQGPVPVRSIAECDDRDHRGSGSGTTRSPRNRES